MSEALPSPAARARAARDLAVLIALQKARDEQQRVLESLRSKLFLSSTDPRRQSLMERVAELADRIRELDAELGPEPTPGG